LFVNFFQPSFKLAEKTREGARVRKRHHPPATPCQRLLADPNPVGETLGRINNDFEQEKQRQHELQMQQQELRMRQLELQALRAQQEQSYREAYQQGRVAAAQEAITAFRTGRAAPTASCCTPTMTQSKAR
jgi:hypothetical protein